MAYGEKRNAGPGKKTAENDPFAGGDSPPSKLTGDMANGTYDPFASDPVKARAVEGEKNDAAYGAPTAASNAAIQRGFKFQPIPEGVVYKSSDSAGAERNK